MKIIRIAADKVVITVAVLLLIGVNTINAQMVKMPIINNELRIWNDYKQASTLEEKVSLIKEYESILIDKRVNDINLAYDTLKITTNLPESISFEIQANLEKAKKGLLTLKKEISDNDDLEIIKAEIESIYYDYRVYLVELPKNAGLLAAGRIDGAISLYLPTIKTSAQASIKVLKALQVDVTELNDKYNRIINDFSRLESLSNEAKNEFRLMQPAKELESAEKHRNAGKQKLLECTQIIYDLKAQILALNEELNAMLKK